MRSALALSALLLLLLLPPPSLSQDDAPAKSVPPALANPTGTRTAPSTESGTTARAQAPTTSPAPAPTAAATAGPATTSPVPSTSAPAQSGPTTTKVASSTQDSGSPAGAVATTQGSSTRPAPAAASASPGNTAVQGGSPPTPGPVTTQSTSAPVSGAPVSAATQSPPVTSHASPSGPPSDVTTVTGQTPESSPDGQQSHAVVPGASSPAWSTGSPRATGMPTTEASSVSAVAPQGIPQGTPQNSSQVSLGPTPSSSTTPLPGSSSSSPSSETVTTPAVGEHTPSSTYLASTAPPGLSTTSSPLAPGKPKVDCVPPEQPDEKLLILNLTETSPCGKSPPADDKLVTQLCRAVKATFNPAQDACTVQLAPIQKSQAVAIKKITIQTHLLPEDVYGLLKDKWDDLREVGVSHMQLGDEGPPEEAEDRFSMPLIITIVCMASFLLLVAALYGCCHQRLSQRKDQQRLTEELQTVENGYHDNPTLEVMETSSEMQEKKVVNLNGELGDSWIVPLDNLTKDDLDEEDTHL